MTSQSKFITFAAAPQTKLQLTTNCSKRWTGSKVCQTIWSLGFRI